MDKKSERCIFTSYSDQHKGYKLYNPITKNIVVTKRCEIPWTQMLEWSLLEDLVGQVD